MTTAIAESLQPLHNANGEAAIVFDRARLPQAGYELFEPAAWGGDARPVGERGGRGAAWFVRGEFGEAVLRHYRRGGLVARLNRDRYLWRGADRTRSFAEFRLLAELRGLDLPVPAPIAAGYRRRGLTYTADILVQRIPGARSLAELLRDDLDAPPWARVGEVLAAFHRAGVCHADLNAHNILVDPGRSVWLIDFDRGRRRRVADGWRHANLRRLERSLLKLRDGRAVEEVMRCHRVIVEGYESAWAGEGA